MIQKIPLDKLKNLKDITILDTRCRDFFEKGHIPLSISIPFGGNFSYWSQLLINKTKPLVLIAFSEEIDFVVKELYMVGFEKKNIYWIESSYLNNATNLETNKSIQVQELKLSENYLIIDVRTKNEWDEGHIKNAMHLPLDQLANKPTLNNEKLTAVICKSGFRSHIAVSLLKYYGINKVVNVEGGMDYWQKFQDKSF